MEELKINTTDFEYIPSSLFKDQETLNNMERGIVKADFGTYNHLARGMYKGPDLPG